MTSQRRDVGSTNIEVNKRQRRDVNTISASPSLKPKRGPEFEEGGSYEGGHGNQNTNDLDPEEKTDFCIFFFSDRSTDVL